MGLIGWGICSIDNVPPVEGEYALNVEAFAPVLAVTYLEGCGGKASEFIPAAVELVNSKVVGPCQRLSRCRRMLFFG